MLEPLQDPGKTRQTTVWRWRRDNLYFLLFIALSHGGWWGKSQIFLMNAKLAILWSSLGNKNNEQWQQIGLLTDWIGHAYFHFRHTESIPFTDSHIPREWPARGGRTFWKINKVYNGSICEIPTAKNSNSPRGPHECRWTWEISR